MRNPALRPPRLIAHLLANLAEGLHAIHSLCTADGPVHAVHQDITPDSLFVLFDGSVRVADFGSAWIRDLLRGKHVVVDGAYLAPEQLEHGPIDARVDIWALGVVLWELLAGRRLFHSTPERRTALELRTRRIAAPSEYHPKVPAELDRIVLKALAREPSERYASARELSVDLAEYLARSGGALAGERSRSVAVATLAERRGSGARNARACQQRGAPAPFAELRRASVARAQRVHARGRRGARAHGARSPGRLANATLHAAKAVGIPGPIETLSSIHVAHQLTPSKASRAARLGVNVWRPSARPAASLCSDFVLATPRSRALLPAKSPISLGPRPYPLRTGCP